MYIMAFAGLLTTLYAVSGLLSVLLGVPVAGDALAGAEGDIRTRVSLYIAALVVGLPIWLGLWRPAQRAAAASPADRGAPERRLYLGAVFAVTAVVSLFALKGLLDYLFTLPAPRDLAPAAHEAVSFAVRLAVFGAAWLLHARLGWRERRPEAADNSHDLAIYIVTGFGLGMLALAAAAAVGRIISELQSSPALYEGAPDSGWDFWGGVAAAALAGGAVWTAARLYDERRGGKRDLRVAYLYLVLVASVALTLSGANELLSNLLRRAFGAASTDGWRFLEGTVPILVVGGALWLYHWQNVRAQARYDRAGRQTPGAILWPRRPGILALHAVGLAMSAAGLIMLLRTFVEYTFALQEGTYGLPADWYPRVMAGHIATLLIGLVIWLPTLLRLQGASAAAPTEERTAQERRQIVGVIVVVSALAGIAFTVALLWQLLQAVLGAGFTEQRIGEMLQSLASLAVAAAAFAYYGLLLRGDMRLDTARRRKVHVTALVADGTEELVAQLRESTGQRIEVVGRLSSPNGAAMDLAALEQWLTEPDVYLHGQERALLILQQNGGNLYPYSRRD